MKNKLLIFIIILLIIFLSILGSTSLYLYSEIKTKDLSIEKLEKENNDLNIELTKLKEGMQEYQNNNSLASNELNNNENKEVKDSQEYKNIVNITYNEFQKMQNNNDTFILFASQTTCGHCIAFKPILNQVLEKYNMVAYELDLRKIENLELRKKIINEYNIDGTPMLIFFENGLELDKSTRINGYKEATGLEKSLNKIDFINKNI